MDKYVLQYPDGVSAALDEISEPEAIRCGEVARKEDSGVKLIKLDPEKGGQEIKF